MAFIRQIIVGMLLLWGIGYSYGQMTQPPAISPPADSTATVAIDTFNYAFPPADRPHKVLQHLLQKIDAANADPATFIQSVLEKEQRPYTGEHRGREKNARPLWVLFTVFILFLAIAIVRLLFPADFTVVVQAYYQERMLQQVSKEDNMLTSWPYIFLYLIFSLALGLFIVLVESSFIHYDLLNTENYMRTAFIVCILFILKILFIRFISHVFELDRLVREYIAVLYLVYFNSMLFLMPFLLTLVFVPASYMNVIVILFSVIVTILFIYRFLRTALRLFGTLRFSLFYLILYLCALEVAPILILIKTLSK